MPEGDSLARAARRLQVLVGQRIEAEAPHPRAAVKRVAERIDGRRLLAVEAVGKNLLLRFQGRAHVAGAVTSVRAEQASGTSLDFTADIRNNGNLHAMPIGVLTVTRSGRRVFRGSGPRIQSSPG